MRSILICCILLASAHDISSTTMRPKRNLGSIKNLISSKLFGADTVLIQLPDIPKDEKYQLFKIKGYDNVFLKVTKKPKEQEIQKIVNIKNEDPVIVRPELAIVGNYLGTNTEKETMLALEIVKNLMKSGILKNEREKTVEKIVVPTASQDIYKNYIIQEHIKPVGMMTEERDPIYLYPQDPIIETETFNVVHNQPVEIYPGLYSPMTVGSEIKYRPFRTKFSYKQETEDADMTYESYNNHGVIVTRTNKVPVKPRYISLRLADVVSIAANPFLVRAQESASNTTKTQEHLKETLQVVPIHSYVTENRHPSTSRTTYPQVVEEPKHDGFRNLNRFGNSFDIYPPKVSEFLNIPDFIKHSKLPFDLRDHLTDGEIEKLNNFINTKLNNTKEGVTSKPFEESKPSANINEDQSKVSSSGLINSGKIVSRYSYKQLGDEGHDTTVVRIEDPRLNQTVINEINTPSDLPRNFVYVPPEDTYVPPPIPNANTLNAIISPPMLNAYNISANVPAPVTTTDNKNIQKIHRHNDYKGHNNYDDENYPRTSVPMILRGDQGGLGVAIDQPGQLKTNRRPSLLKDPIMVPETGYKQDEVTSNSETKTSTGKPFIGGKRTYTTSTWNRIYTGGPVV